MGNADIIGFINCIVLNMSTHHLAMLHIDWVTISRFQKRKQHAKSHCERCFQLHAILSRNVMMLMESTELFTLWNYYMYEYLNIFQSNVHYKIKISTSTEIYSIWFKECTCSYFLRWKNDCSFGVRLTIFWVIYGSSLFSLVADWTHTNIVSSGTLQVYFIVYYQRPLRLYR